MGMRDDPFRALEAELRRYILGANVQAILVNVRRRGHEREMALAHFLDGKVSLRSPPATPTCRPPTCACSRAVPAT